MIVIEPTGGLGNRMLALKSAYYFAMQMKTKLVIVWHIDADECFIRFQEILSSFGDGTVKIKLIELQDEKFKKFNHKRFSWITFLKEGREYRKYKIMIIQVRILRKKCIYFDNHIENIKQFLKENKYKKSIYFWAYSDFYGKEDFSLFHFNTSLIRTADCLTEKYKGGGVYWSTY